LLLVTAFPRHASRLIVTRHGFFALPVTTVTIVTPSRTLRVTRYALLSRVTISCHGLYASLVTPFCHASRFLVTAFTSAALWKDYLATWTAWNTVRTLAAFAASTLFIVSLRIA